MLTQTSEMAIKAMVYLVVESGGNPAPPRQIASKMDCSPSYLAKIVGDLVKAGFLRSRRGSLGGVALARDPKEITLLQIVEACQGPLIESFCQDVGSDMSSVCSFHRAMWEVFSATRNVLERWTLEGLAENPQAEGSPSSPHPCRMSFLKDDCAASCAAGCEGSEESDSEHYKHDGS